jgi:RNA polymerase sigma-70 factor, ECF subfamily
MKSIQVDTDVLAALMKEGDVHAFRSLFDRFRSPVYAYCTRMLGDRDEADDAMQETFIHALRDVTGLKSPDKFRGWLFGIARHRVLMIIRERRNGLRETPGGDAWDDETPLTMAERSDIQLHVRAAVAALSPAYREVVLLRDFQHLTYAEIALATDSTESAVRSRLHKARKALVTRLAPLFAEENADEMRGV